MLSLGPRFPLTFWLWLLPTCLSASNVGKGQSAASNICSSPLVFAQSFVLSAGQAVPQSFLQKSYLSLSLFFFSSLAIPQFGLLSHVSSLRLSSGHSGPVLTLSNADHTSLFSPCLLVADACVWATYLLGVIFRYMICEFYLFIFSSRLCCPLRFQNSPQAHWWEGFLVFENFSSFMTPSLRQVSIPNSFASLFIFFPTSFQRQWDAFLGVWCPLRVFRSSFVELAQSSNDLLMSLWGRKWSPHPIPLPSSLKVSKLLHWLWGITQTLEREKNVHFMVI